MNKTRYGQFEIYEEELDDLSYQPSGLIDKLIFNLGRSLYKSQELEYSFSVPASEYLRGELFCNDVSEAMECKFTQRDLISLLLDDFLYQAKQRNNPYDLYHELDIRSEHSFKVNSYEGGNKTYNRNTSKGKERIFECTIRRKEALRLEVMLSDIAELGENKSFTVNQVLRILYSDFIQKYRTGNLTNVIENIVARYRNL
ncbi:hypothetical protein NX029_12360 [Cytobacillus firmus]|nr:hypothetical protein [Cytobacillus firmus]